MTKGALMGIFIAIIVILVVLYFSFGRSKVEAPTGGTAAVTEVAPPPEETSSEMTRTFPDGLIVTDTRIGTGTIEAKPHDVVVVHYTGMLENGTKFDSSYDRGEPIKLPIGEGKVIKGWDEGLLGMRKGGKRHLIIPASLAYGAQSPSPLIPPNSTLVFDVEMVDVWLALVNQPPR